MQGLQDSVATTLKATLNRLRKMATGIVPEGYRLHDDFAFTYNGWHINRHAKREGLVPDVDAMKIRLLFDEVAKLDNCPFMARLSYSMDLTKSHRFCAFLYPRERETLDDIRAWAAEQGFEQVSALNAGNALSQWEHAHRLEAMS